MKSEKYKQYYEEEAKIAKYRKDDEAEQSASEEQADNVSESDNVGNIDSDSNDDGSSTIVPEGPIKDKHIPNYEEDDLLYG